MTLTLNRTDSQDAYTLYAMQDELCYDSEFFRLVADSALPASDITATDIALRDHYRAFYMNCLSLSGGVLWDSSTLVGSFRLEVIGTTGASSIFSCNHLVSKPDGSGSFGTAAQDLTVVVSDRCTVQFETGGGTPVSPQTVDRGSKIPQPADPSQPGFRFAGWYQDIDCTQPWDFSSDTVSVNLHLYARWLQDGPAACYEDVHSTHWFYGDVAFVSANGLMAGMGSGRFAPYEKTSRAMMVTILWRLEGMPSAQGQLTFLDVPPAQWYTEAVRWAAEKQIVTGYSPQAFGPHDGITREQMAAILYRYGAYKGYDVTARADLSMLGDSGEVSPWAREALSWANGAGLITGMPGELLAPQDPATRCQTAAILHRFCVDIRYSQ